MLALRFGNRYRSGVLARCCLLSLIALASACAAPDRPKVVRPERALAPSKPHAAGKPAATAPELSWVRLAGVPAQPVVGTPKVEITAPACEASLDASAAALAPVVVKLSEWSFEGGRGVQLGLDHFRPRLTSSEDAPMRLSDLVPADTDLEPGEHLLWAVAVHQNGETVKPAPGRPLAPAALCRFWVGPKGRPTLDVSAPRLFYSLPRGTYNGERAADQILLDFYLFNVDPRAPFALIATVEDASGRRSQKVLPTWQPYLLGSAPSGDYRVDLELRLDVKGAAPAVQRVGRVITVNREVAVEDP